MTIKDITEILGFLEVAQRTTERAIADSSMGSLYRETMERQLERLNNLINRLEETKI